MRTVPQMFALSGLLLLPYGCVHEKAQGTGDSVPAVSDLDIRDPDPEKDEKGPPFCNPTGKQGDELKKCYEHNAQLYKAFEDEAKAREPWFNFASDSWAQSTELDPKYVLPVIKQDEAVKKLAAVSSVEISDGDVRRFTGKSLTYPGMKPYLVRSLMYFKDTGTFSVFERDQSIFVRHDSIGTSNPGETRTGLVVFLPFKPKAVFVDCQVTE